MSNKLVEVAMVLHTEKRVFVKCENQKQGNQIKIRNLKTINVGFRTGSET